MALRNFREMVGVEDYDVSRENITIATRVLDNGTRQANIRYESTPDYNQYQSYPSRSAIVDTSYGHNQLYPAPVFRSYDDDE